MREIHWAVLGTGVIANEMATALEKNGKKLYAVGNRTYEKAVKFGEKYGIKKVYTDFNEMFTDPEVDVIYITTPHNTHIQFMKKAIENGKHILVEKSITLNSKELDEALELAKEKGVIVAEAMTIFHMPVYKELKKILESGKLGNIRPRLADKGEAPLPFLRQRDKRHGGDRLPAGLPPDTAHPVFPEGAQQVPPEVVIPHRAAHGRLQPVPGGGDGHICRGAPGVSNIASGLTAWQKVN